MATPIAYDTVRLLLGSLAATPRGIDRVDLRYARYFFETWPGDCVGTLPTPWGVRWYDRQRVLQELDRLEQLWLETVRSDEDHVLGRIKRRLSGRHEPQHPATGKDRRQVADPGVERQAGGEQQQRVGGDWHHDCGTLGRPRGRVNR